MNVEKLEADVRVPSVYVSNERGSSSLRNRNKSQDSPAACIQLAKDFVAIRRKIGHVDGEPDLQSTPKGDRDLCEAAVGINDSGYTSKGGSFFSSFLSDHLGSPFGKEKSRLFDVDETAASLKPYLKPQVWVPFVLLFVVLASSFVAIFTFNAAIQGDGERVPNGKYRAIEFAHARRLKREADVSEGEDAGEDDVISEDAPLFDSLEFIEELRQYAESRMKEKERAKQQDEQKKELLEKIGSFGHFATSVVKPLDSGKAAPKDKKKLKRSPKSPNRDPFRFRKQPVSDPNQDPPFVDKDKDGTFRLA